MARTGVPFARRLAATFLTAGLAGAPVLAETPAAPPLVEITFGDLSLVAGPDDIRSVTQAQDGAQVPTLYIQLDARLDRRMSEVTAPNVGRTGRVQICGETVAEPILQAPIPVADFLIADADPAVIDRLEALLVRRSCDPAPQS